MTPKKFVEVDQQTFARLAALNHLTKRSRTALVAEAIEKLHAEILNGRLIARQEEDEEKARQEKARLEKLEPISAEGMVL